VEAWAASWNHLRFDRMADLWDAEDPEATYIGDEIRDPLHGLLEIREHLDRTAGRVVAAEVTLAGLRARTLAPDVALATFLCSWALTTVEVAEPYRTHTMVTLVLRRRPPGWRIAHYAESPRHLVGDTTAPS
jgi:uncharacterized protein (TIGR02246 family)